MRIARLKLTVSLVAPLAALAFAAVVCASSAFAQDQDNSLAAAARRAQEAKKDQPKAAKVWDNANLPSTGGVNVVGQQPAAAGSNTAADSTALTVQAADAKPAPTKAELATLNSDLATAKQRVADLKADLDLAQRKFTLDQSTYLSNPNHVNDRATAAALDAEKSDVDAKAEAVALAEKLLASAQAKVDEATKESAAADKAAKDQAAQDKSAAASPQPAPAAPPPASTGNPDSTPVVVDR
jgi:hypothetical protein